MSFQAYLAFLIEYLFEEKKIKETDERNEYSNRWFGLVPFLVKTSRFGRKKEVLRSPLKIKAL